LVFGAELEHHHDYQTRLQSKTEAMAPAKSDDLVTQLLAKIEEGNKETHRRMEVMPAEIRNMESTLKSVMGGTSGVLEVAT
jgi:hypothetical protein